MPLLCLNIKFETKQLITNTTETKLHFLNSYNDTYMIHIKCKFKNKDQSIKHLLVLK